MFIINQIGKNLYIRFTRISLLARAVKVNMFIFNQIGGKNTKNPCFRFSLSSLIPIMSFIQLILFVHLKFVKHSLLPAFRRFLVKSIFIDCEAWMARGGSSRSCNTRRKTHFYCGQGTNRRSAACLLEAQPFRT